MSNKEADVERSYPIPAVGVVVERDKQVLLILKGRGLFQGQWCIPGGKIEVGESVLQAVEREVREETGLTITDPEFLLYEQEIVRSADGEVQQHFVFLNFRARAPAGTLCAGDDAAETRFLDVAELGAIPLSAPTERTFRWLGYLPD